MRTITRVVTSILIRIPMGSRAAIITTIRVALRSARF